MKPVRQYILRKFMMALWGLFTLVLLFTVALLAYVLIQDSEAPLEAISTNLAENFGATQTPGAPTPTGETRRSSAPMGEREVLLYFANRDGVRLRPKTVSLPYTESTVENCRIALEALIAGPDSDQHAPIMPDTVRVRALYVVDNGELVIDLSRELLTEHALFSSVNQESLLVYGIVNTLTQGALQGSRDVQIRQVRILVEGARPETYPMHVDVSEPLPPDNRWLESAHARPTRTLHG